MRHFKCCEPPRILHQELLTRNNKKSVGNNITGDISETYLESKLIVHHIKI